MDNITRRKEILAALKEHGKVNTIELAEKMNQYWVNFITNGDPNGEELAQWPEADENMGYIDFGAGITVHSEPLAPLEELMEEFATQYFQVPLSE